jgi:alpha-L-rhamnosidase
LTRSRFIFPLLAAAALALFAAPASAQTFTAQQKPLVKEPVKPARVVKRSDGIYFVDFGRAAFAQLELDLTAPVQPGKKIPVRLGEMLGDPDHVNRKPGGSVRYLETAITTEANKTAYRAALAKDDARLMPADIGPVMPFRYVELENLPDTTVQALTDAIRQIAVHYPFEDAAADFACSHAKLNAIWDLCKYSMKATSFAGVFVDGDRERKPYEADAYINQLGWYYTTTDTTLPRYTHEYLITHPTWPTEWIMFSVLMGWEDYQYTGDAASLKAFYPDLKAKTLRALERSDGLISTTQPAVPSAVKTAIHFTGTLQDIVDWPAAERDNCDLRPINTVVNAFHCRSLALMANIADALGKPDEAADFRKAADKSLLAFNAKLFDPATGLYIDGEGSKHSSLHANMFPLAFGLVPPDRREKVAAFVQSRGMACSVYGAQFLMDALLDSGRAAPAVLLMEAPGDRSWRHMAEDVGTTVTLEAWDTKYKPNQDWNHAWGAAPANVLPRKILGVTPLEPGYKKALIWPHTAPPSEPGALLWARGKVPTVKGPIVVDWQRGAAGLRLNLTLPAGMPAEVRLPADWGDHVQLDRKPAATAAREGALAVEVPQGKHELLAGQ